MNTHITTIATVLIFSVIAPDPWRSAAHAERLSRSNSPDSTLQSQCDLCWTPSPNGQGLDRLPTHTPHRPPHPPGSRPHRFPKGRYKLAPSPTHPRVSSLRSLSARNARLLRNQQIFVVDGDTIHYGAERIRLRGIDAPELNEPGGQAAKQRLEELLRSGSVQIIPHGVDVYGRTLADVFVNGQNVAEILASEGFVKPRL